MRYPEPRSEEENQAAADGRTAPPGIAATARPCAFSPGPGQLPDVTALFRGGRLRPAHQPGTRGGPEDLARHDHPRLQAMASAVNLNMLASATCEG
jgi:hypothetical protein